MLTKDQILKAPDIKTEVVKVPEWGGDVKIASMNGAIREQFEVVLAEASTNDTTSIRASAAALSIVNTKGKLMFKKSDIEALAEKSCIALDRVYKAVMKLNSLESLEEEVKN